MANRTLDRRLTAWFMFSCIVTMVSQSFQVWRVNYGGKNTLQPSNWYYLCLSTIIYIKRLTNRSHINQVQFVITFTHTTVGLYQSAKGQCSFPLWGQLLLWIYMIIMMCLFTNFFVHEYIKKTNDAKRKMQLKDINNNTIVNGHHKQSKHVNGVAANGKSAEKKVN